MIRPPERNGVAFTEASDGDLRSDATARVRIGSALAIPGDWATVRQVHGDRVVRVDSPGDAGEADALWTLTPTLPISVFTADCFGVVLHAEDAVGVAHAGWRGADAGVVRLLREHMEAAGQSPVRAEVGPGIGPCCFEVGSEVAARFEAHMSETSWGTLSVDLASAISSQLDGLDTWTAAGCTYHEDRWFSHRRDDTTMRLATIGWI